MSEVNVNGYATRYQLVTPEGVESLLSEYEAISGRRFQGDCDASDILLDMDAAMVKAELTPMQLRTIRLVVIDGHTQKEASVITGIAQQNVGKNVKKALEKIAAVYEYWAWRGEGYSLEGLQLDREVSE